MPKLELLEVFGFKSFADKVTVHFDRGVTAIVGPNGCGKSNIADAINWVVGEQSARSLRADRMEEVIFNGTSKRKPLGYTEVSLQLKDFERVVPGTGEGVEEASQLEAVSITRRLYRSGESEYLINEKRCRLKDIYELLEGTGLGHNSYAIIEQGRIDQILSAKPQERRALIEEAAKVSIFKTRKKAAEVRLEMAQQNLARVNDIIVEVGRQANSLRRQAAKARRYGRLREELRIAQRARFYLEFTRFSRKLEVLRSELEQFHSQEQELVHQDRQGEAQRQRLQETQDQLHRRIQSLLELLSRLDVDAERMEQQIRFQNQQAEEARRRLGEARERSAGAREKLSEAGDSHQQQFAQLADARERLSTGQAEVSGLRSELEELQQGIDATQLETERIRMYANSHAGQLAQLRSALARLEESGANLRRQRERAGKERERVAGEQEALEARALTAAEQLSLADGQRQSLQEQVENQRGEVGEWSGRIEASQQELAALSEQESMLRNRLTSLEEIEFHHSNYSEGLQVYLNSVRDSRSMSPRTVADLVEATPQYEGIIEDHLNEQLQYVVVEDLAEAITGVGQAREVKAGKCTFMSLAGVNGHSRLAIPAGDRAPLVDPAVLGRLQDHLRMQPTLGEALRRVFPDLPATYIVGDMDAAVRLSHQHPESAFLTLGGEFLSARGLVTVAGQRKGAVGLLSLRREKKEVQEKVDALQRRIEEARAANVQARSRLRDAQEVLEQAQWDMHQSELDKARLEQTVASMGVEVGRLVSALAEARNEEAQLLGQEALLEREIADIRSEMHQAETSSVSSESTITELAARLAEQQLRKETVGLRLAEARMEVATLQERAVNLEKECARHAREREEIEMQCLQAEREAADSEAAIRQLTESNRQLTLDLAQLKTQRETQGAALQELQAAHEQARADLAAVALELESVRGRREELRQRLSDHEVGRARCETELEALDRSCQEELHLAVRDLAAAFDPSTLVLSEDEVNSRYADLRGRIENFGAVNLGALEEYEEHEKRLRFMVEQQTDIQKSIATTQQTIEELNRHSIQQFRAAFEQINHNFAEVFRWLFSGGHAEMRLMDDSDPMDSGIEIIASPPGKRLQSIMLLSGGEKALTALALLMGIFRFRPAPFCVLDEVDAPLDDSNVQRFTNMISQMNSNTQFIVITHNKRTLEAAQYLYGVTMQEPGVSRIVSVRFE